MAQSSVVHQDSLKMSLDVPGHRMPQAEHVQWLIPPSRGYGSHSRSTSRTSWDGQLAAHQSTDYPRSPSSSYISPRQYRPRERPTSAVSLPDRAYIRPTVLTDRWSYDQQRMPSPPSRTPQYGTRPCTPISDMSGYPSAKPISTPLNSRPPSRPQSVVLDPSANSTYGYFAGKPAARVTPPWANELHAPEAPSDYPQQQQRLREPYHCLTTEELDMLAHPPPRISASTPPELHTGEPIAVAGGQGAKTRDKRSSKVLSKEIEDEDESRKPGCLGLCEIATAKRIGGKFGAWLMGTLVPVTFGLLTRCLSGALSGR